MRKDYTHKNEGWYSIDKDTVIDRLESDIKHGLSEVEAAERLDLFGENVLPGTKRQSNIIRFLKHFNDILIYVLFVAAIVTAILGHYVDTVVILLVAVVNASIGYFQENKAEKALEDIKKLLSLKAQVIRDGIRTEIDASQLVVGDVVLLSPGDKVPADLRLLQTDNLKIEESPLTGESVPSEKKVEALDSDTMLGDRINMAFSSTTVSAGTGLGVVVATGENSEIGKINEMISEVEKITTPLLRQTAKFGKTVSVVIISIAAVIYVFGYFFRDYNSGELLMSVIGLAIAAIPEGLPAILSIILAIGVQNMAKRNAIVRTLPSVETLGAVSVICSDKTGTLTRNEMTVKTVEIRDGDFTVSGTGYAPEGDVLKNGYKIDFNNEPILEELINCFNICNEASLGKDEDGNWFVKGDPTEGALITLYEKADIEHKAAQRKSTIPFDSEYKYMATLNETKSNNIIYIKGAPDRLLDMAEREKTKEGELSFDKEYWEGKITELAQKGQRIIGAAYKIVDEDVNTIEHEDIHDGIVFLGLAGIIDPPREEAVEAIRLCSEAGITVKMITGDHADTAKTIGYEMGIGDGVNALQGKDLEVMSDTDLEAAAEQYDIFARTSPEHKLRLVRALQARGIICAMTGDGVNDAPALKKADVGIAMGIKGTEVTKDASEMILADDNFSTIVAAVEEGRRVYDNLKKTILFILPTNGAESFLIIASILFGTLMPLTPVQILWVNMVTSVTISLALAFEKIEPGTMKRPPRSSQTPLLSGYFIWRILFVSVLIGGGTLWMNINILKSGVSEDVVRTITIQTIVITQMFHLFNSRSIRKFAFNRDFFTNKAVFIVSVLLIALQLGITYLPFMNNVFGTTPLMLSDWIYPFVFGAVVFIIVEIEKAIMRKIDTLK
ncbi:cation-transporting P-type ATPase [Dysgonomonas sp. Marseille-P4677]|uniref:cation-transporting P-type ATPase n=1 Tax=Dysgonomonas sp. Marseille-P4677 TaxID=2364790 RepID=UPI0019113673|nr:cation-transporting P-type ATPase [Dysgonomonas sp. Marseille-P4677]MBK5722855.1 cation-transporting P-type ATPase [Dysgonomonas sp. Marseille-P4677]